MKLNKILLYALIVLPMLLLQSCLKNQEDIFDTPSAIRMQEVLDNAKKVLTSSEEGWAFDYYPDRYLSYGGYAFTLKFDNQKVTVGSELETNKFESSLYKMTNDNGPMLSFDSYNTLMHFFATPSSEQYEAFDGDFEFIIMNVTDDLITLNGKRTGNTMYLRRLTKTPDTFIKAVFNISENIIITSAKGTLGASELSCAIDLDVRRMDITYMKGNESILVSECFIPTETGIRFYNPMDLNGATLSELAYNIDTSTFSGKDSKGNDITLVGTLSEDYTPFSQFEGKYDLTYLYGTIEVTLVPDKENNRYLIRGLNEKYDVIANYIKAKGYLNITSQKVGENGSDQIWLCGWGLKGGGNLNNSPKCGMYLVRSIENEGTYNFQPNDYIDIAADSFILYVSNGSQLTGAASAPWLINNDFRVPYLKSLIKK